MVRHGKIVLHKHRPTEGPIAPNGKVVVFERECDNVVFQLHVPEVAFEADDSSMVPRDPHYLKERSPGGQAPPVGVQEARNRDLKEDIFHECVCRIMVKRELKVEAAQVQTLPAREVPMAFPKKPGNLARQKQTIRVEAHRLIREGLLARIARQVLQELESQEFVMVLRERR